MESQFGFRFYVFPVLIGQAAGADDHHVLEIVAFSPEAAEHQPHECVFENQEEIDREIEDQDHATGKIHQAEHEEQGRGHQSGNRDRDEKNPEFPQQAFCPGGIIKAHHGKHNEEHQGISGGKQNRPGIDQRHVAAVVFQIDEPEPGSKNIGEDDQQHVQQDVDTVDEFLILPDHTLSASSLLFLLSFSVFTSRRRASGRSGPFSGGS